LNTTGSDSISEHAARPTECSKLEPEPIDVKGLFMVLEVQDINKIIYQSAYAASSEKRLLRVNAYQVLSLPQHTMPKPELRRLSCNMKRTVFYETCGDKIAPFSCNCLTL